MRVLASALSVSVWAASCACSRQTNDPAPTASSVSVSEPKPAPRPDTSTSRPKAPAPHFKNGQPMIKVVAIGYSGVGDWVRSVQRETKEERRGKLVARDHEGWRVTAFDYESGTAIGGRPVHVYLFGHEGLGFIGQPGAAKDVVYKNAHAIIALASTEDANDLSGVLEADLSRMRSQGHHPAVVFAAPERALGRSKSNSRAVVDWSSKPTLPLELAVKEALGP